MLGGLKWLLEPQITFVLKQAWLLYGWLMTLATCESMRQSVVTWWEESGLPGNNCNNGYHLEHSLRGSHPWHRASDALATTASDWSKVTFGYVDCTLRLYSSTDCDGSETFLNRPTSVLWRFLWSTTQCRRRLLKHQWVTATTRSWTAEMVELMDNLTHTEG